MRGFDPNLAAYDVYRSGAWQLAQAAEQQGARILGSFAKSLSPETHLRA